MRKILTIIFTLFLCFNFINCASTSLPTQIINIDENPDSEFVVNAIYLKEPIQAKFVLEKGKSTADKKYYAEKAEILQFITINPKDRIKIRFNAKSYADKLFKGESDFDVAALRFSTGNWGHISSFSYLIGKSKVITLTRNGKLYNSNTKTYKDTK